MQEGVPEPLPDSFPESLRTSLSSVWFARTTPDKIFYVTYCCQFEASCLQLSYSAYNSVCELLPYKRISAYGWTFFAYNWRLFAYNGNICVGMDCTEKKAQLSAKLLQLYVKNSHKLKCPQSYSCNMLQQCYVMDFATNNQYGQETHCNGHCDNNNVHGNILHKLNSWRFYGCNALELIT